MNVINKKSHEQTPNYFYGVDVNNKEAVREEYERLRKKHRNITIFAIIVLGCLSFVLGDFLRVTKLGGKPIFATSKKVERGTLFSGLGYKVLYCNNGQRYVGSVLYKSCEEFDENTFANVLYEKLVNYSADNKTLNRSKLKDFTVIDVMFDEENEEEGSDYLATISFSCNGNNSSCFKTAKEYNDPYNIKLYVRFNKFNEIYDVVPFKESGAYYNELVEQYTPKVQEYLRNNNLLVADNLHHFTIKLLENHGKYKFRGETYADSYLIQIDYNCLDNTNTCVTPAGNEDFEGDYSNLSFYMAMFLDAEDNVSLMGPKEYFDL